ncbi:unnamed protein product [Closterium sp. NIES-65]|nr:unnamed protein product [Closterium sp. NIES-65]
MASGVIASFRRMVTSCIIALLLTSTGCYQGPAVAAAVVTIPGTPSPKVSPKLSLKIPPKVPPKVPPPLPAGRIPGGGNVAAGGNSTWQPSDSWQPELTLLANNSYGARCLDGSPPGYYFRPGSGEGADAWHVHLPMGGWCFNLSTCADRAKTFLGSSRADLQEENPYRHVSEEAEGDCHSLLPPSLLCCLNPSSLNVTNVSPSLPPSLPPSLHALPPDLLTNRGLHSATSLLLSGASAGGQAVVTFCGLLANSVAHPSAVKCLLDSAFFTDSLDRNGYPYFQHTVKSMAELHESVGNPKCAKAQPPAKKWRCFFPQYALAFVTRRPVFIVQPLFDFRALVRGNQLPEDYGYVLNCLRSLLSLPVLPEKKNNPKISRQAFDLAAVDEGGSEEGLLQGWKEIEGDGYTTEPSYYFRPGASPAPPVKRTSPRAASSPIAGGHVAGSAQSANRRWFASRSSGITTGKPNQWASSLPAGGAADRATWQPAQTPGGDPEIKIHIHLPAGGWCFNAQECLNRSLTFLGSSEGWPTIIPDVSYPPYPAPPHPPSSLPPASPSPSQPSPSPSSPFPPFPYTLLSPTLSFPVPPPSTSLSCAPLVPPSSHPLSSQLLRASPFSPPPLPHPSPVSPHGRHSERLSGLEPSVRGSAHISSSPPLLSAPPILPQSVPMGGILNDDPDVNPLFADWPLARINYCDGGGFAGQRGRINVTIPGAPVRGKQAGGQAGGQGGKQGRVLAGMKPGPGGPGAGGGSGGAVGGRPGGTVGGKPGGSAGGRQKIVPLYMDGWNVVRSIIDDLKAKRGFNLATEVLLSGSSAGGQATIYLCDRVAAAFPTATTRCVADSGYFVNSIDRNGTRLWERLAKSISTTQQLSNPACRKRTHAELSGLEKSAEPLRNKQAAGNTPAGIPRQRPDDGDRRWRPEGGGKEDVALRGGKRGPGGMRAEDREFRVLPLTLKAMAVASAYRVGESSFVVMGEYLTPVLAHHLKRVLVDECAWEGETDDHAVTAAEFLWLRKEDYHGTPWAPVMIRCTFARPVGGDNNGGSLLLRRRGTEEPRAIVKKFPLVIQEIEMEVLREEPGAFELIKQPPIYELAHCSGPLYGHLRPRAVSDWLHYHSRAVGVQHFFLHDFGAISGDYSTTSEDTAAGPAATAGAAAGGSAASGARGGSGVSRVGGARGAETGGEEEPSLAEAVAPFEARGLVTVTRLLGHERFRSHYWHQILTQNDCLYRARYTARWLIFTNMYEYLPSLT